MAAQQARDALPVLCDCLRSWLRPDFYGFPYRALSPLFITQRKRAMFACLLEMVFCIFSLPLAAWRGGISKASTGINVVLMIIALWGLIASTRADYLWVAAHSALVFGLVGIFSLYIFLTIAFGNGDSGNLIVIFVFIFILVDLIVACITAHFVWAIRVELGRLKGMDAAEIARAAAGAQLRVEMGLPVNGDRGANAQRQAAPAHAGAPPHGALATAAPQRQPQPQARAGSMRNGKNVDPPAQSNGGAVAVNVGVPVDNQVGAGPDDPQEECVVCMARPRNAWLYRCGHNVVCMPCGELLKTNGEPCPVCRADITDVVRKY